MTGWAIAVALGLLGSVSIAAQWNLGSAAAPQVREVPFSGTPLLEQIRQGEDALIVRSGRSRPLEVGPPAHTSTFDWMASLASAVVVVDVIGRSSVLTPAGDWITSTIEASIIDVFKTSARWTARHGETFSFDEDGGVAMIGGTRVHAVVPWARPFESGKRYLLFVSVDPSNDRILIGHTASYDLSGARPLRLGGIEGRRDDIEATETLEALGRVRTAAATAR